MNPGLVGQGKRVLILHWYMLGEIIMLELGREYDSKVGGVGWRGDGPWRKVRTSARSIPIFLPGNAVY